MRTIVEKFINPYCLPPGAIPLAEDRYYLMCHRVLTAGTSAVNPLRGNCAKWIWNFAVEPTLHTAWPFECKSLEPEKWLAFHRIKSQVYPNGLGGEIGELGFFCSGEIIHASPDADVEVEVEEVATIGLGFGFEGPAPTGGLQVSGSYNITNDTTLDTEHSLPEGLASWEYTFRRTLQKTVADYARDILWVDTLSPLRIPEEDLCDKGFYRAAPFDLAYETKHEAQGAESNDFKHAALYVGPVDCLNLFLKEEYRIAVKVAGPGQSLDADYANPGLCEDSIAGIGMKYDWPECVEASVPSPTPWEAPPPTTVPAATPTCLPDTC